MGQCPQGMGTGAPSRGTGSGAQAPCPSSAPQPRPQQAELPPCPCPHPHPRPIPTPCQRCGSPGGRTRRAPSWSRSVRLLASTLNFSAQASRSSFTPTTGAVGRWGQPWHRGTMGTHPSLAVTPSPLPTCWLQRLAPNAKLHGGAHQDPDGVVLQVQPPVAGCGGQEWHEGTSRASGSL